MVNHDGDWEPQVEAWKSVHHAYCDQCNNHRYIIGTRHKSLELDDYDLCEACFKNGDRKAEAWAEIQEEEDEYESESEDEDYPSLEHPFFRAILKARKENRIERHGA